MHPLLHRAGCIVPCIIVCQISQLSPHVLIQSMRTSFCIYRRIIRQNTGHNYQTWAIGAGYELLGVILSDEGFYSSALFSLLMTAFRVEIRDLSRNAPYDYKGEINALWAAIRELQKEVAPPEPDDEWPEFVQPTGAGTAYQVGDKITFKGVRYVCRLPHCVWSPADYPIGWQKQA